MFSSESSGSPKYIIDFVHKDLFRNYGLCSKKFDVAIATFKNLLNMAVLEQRLNKMDIEKLG